MGKRRELPMNERREAELSLLRRVGDNYGSRTIQVSGQISATLPGIARIAFEGTERIANIDRGRPRDFQLHRSGRSAEHQRRFTPQQNLYF